MERASVQFGAGALGRGLVVPRLVAAGWSVTVVDPLPELVDRLRAQGGYWLEMGDQGAASRQWVPVGAALHPSRDRPALLRLLAAMPLVTTAVRKENLPKVAADLALAWERRSRPALLVGCENIERVDEVLAAALAEAGLSAERLAQIAIPRTVVDRICASDWPASTTIRAEAYAELAMSGPAVPGIDSAPDIDAAFDRKRYLVNSMADAAAILGRARGHSLLSEAFLDRPLLDELAPLLAALTRHLVLAHGLDAASLEDYAANSCRRLANSLIPRRLDTVARDIWRKMQPAERFFAPLIALERRGESLDAALPVMARLAALGAALDGSEDRPAYTAADLRHLGQASGTAVRSVYGRIADMMAAAPRTSRG